MENLSFTRRLSKMSKPIVEINKPFKTMLEAFNSFLKAMSDSGYKIYDVFDSSSYYVKGVIYNKEKDRLEIDWEDDNNAR